MFMIEALNRTICILILFFSSCSVFAQDVLKSNVTITIKKFDLELNIDTNNRIILLNHESNYWVYNSSGSIVKSGIGKVILYENLSLGKYFLCFEKATFFSKKKSIKYNHRGINPNSPPKNCCEFFVE